jgi:hypothetical protein
MIRLSIQEEKVQKVHEVQGFKRFGFKKVQRVQGSTFKVRLRNMFAGQRLISRAG